MNDDAPTVAIVGGGPARTDLPDAVGDALADAGVDVAARGSAAIADDDGAGGATPHAVVAVGERAVAEVAATDPSVPVIPVDAGAGIRSVPASAVDRLPAAVYERDWATERHVALSVAVGGEPTGTAVFDVTLVTTEAARISEYDVIADGEHLDRSRADGVVVATPAGSTDYARRVDAPVLAPGTGIAVAWIAPFRTDPDRWVLSPSSLEIRVEREEATVDLSVDDRVRGSVDPDDAVTIAPTDPFAVAVLELGRDRYE